MPSTYEMFCLIKLYGRGDKEYIYIYQALYTCLIHETKIKSFIKCLQKTDKRQDLFNWFSVQFYEAMAVIYTSNVSN